MSFVTLSFAGLLVPVFILYYILPVRFRWALLLAASLGFYAFSGVLALAMPLILACAVYVCALSMERFPRLRIPLLLGGITFLLLLWGIPKWNHISLIGFSFYLLQAIGYLLDVKNGEYPAERNPLHLLLFLSFFPLSVQGPICRYPFFQEALAHGINPPAKPGTLPRRFKAGAGRVLFGYFKKLVIADRIALFTGALFAAPEQYRGLPVLAALLAYTVQLYMDFTGGMDIALGVAQCFGITLPENFDRPLAARSLSEYWRRWHISLGTWFRDYVFYPLSLFLPASGSRFPLYAATLLTWSLTGLWHGFSLRFLLWGLANGGILLLEREVALRQKRAGRKQRRPSRVPSQLCVAGVFLITSLLRAFDCYPSAAVAVRQLASLFSPALFFSGRLFENSAVQGGMALPGLGLPELVLLPLCLLLVAFITRKAQDTNPSAFFLRLSPAPCMFLYCLFGILILVCGVYGAGYDATGFIYGGFV